MVGFFRYTSEANSRFTTLLTHFGAAPAAVIGIATKSLSARTFRLPRRDRDLAAAKRPPSDICDPNAFHNPRFKNDRMVDRAVHAPRAWRNFGPDFGKSRSEGVRLTLRPENIGVAHSPW